MLVYNDVTSIEARMVPEGRFKDNQWCLSNVRVVLIHEVANGTAMGTNMAPSYANIFMEKHEILIMQAAPYKPVSWFRFIDDVNMKWTESYFSSPSHFL
jgi:hypothetical protein